MQSASIDFDPRCHRVRVKPVPPVLQHLVQRGRRLRGPLSQPTRGQDSLAGAAAWVCPAGLQQVLTPLLNNAGLITRNVLPQSANLPELGPADKSHFRIRDPAVLDFVQRERRGIISFAGDRVDPAALIGQVAVAWPEQRILILTSSDKEGIDLGAAGFATR